MSRIDTDLNDCPTPDFKTIGRQIFVGDTLATSTARRVYVPSKAAQAWDGVKATHALGSRHGGYSYANIKVTGRKDLYTSHGIVRKVRLQVGLDGAFGPDESYWVDGWMIGGGDTVAG